VISLDLGWSNAIDQQAFDRVHRLGQTKEVYINRLIIANTVEARVREIQDRKQGLSDGALGEGSGQRVRLSVGELAHCELSLFQSTTLCLWLLQCLVLRLHLSNGYAHPRRYSTKLLFLTNSFILGIS
jgi:hypothetical protein